MSSTTKVPDQFHGWLGKDPSSAEGNLTWGPFTPRPFTPDSIDIQISHCGICASDLHTLRSGWGETPYPCVVGHEIIGRAVRVGSAVTHVKEGDRVGVGAQADSCKKPDCPDCADGRENHCVGMVNTYAARWPGTDHTSYGGYADFHRAVGRFTVKIPEGLDSAVAAPLLCAGITVYSPLKRGGCGPGKRVGIVGVGGLGHYGILFAKALGAAEVVAISRTSTKKADAAKLGATGFIATEESTTWAQEHGRSLDLIVCTVSSASMPLNGYLSLLAPNGEFVQVGAPEDALPVLNAFNLIVKATKIGGSIIGPPGEIEEMLALAAEKGVNGWIVTRPMKDANQAIVDQENGKARYRYVLAN